MDKHDLYTGGPLVDDLIAKVEQQAKEIEALKVEVRRLAEELHGLKYPLTYAC